MSTITGETPKPVGPCGDVEVGVEFGAPVPGSVDAAVGESARCAAPSSRSLEENVPTAPASRESDAGPKRAPVSSIAVISTVPDSSERFSTRTKPKGGVFDAATRKEACNFFEDL